MHGKKTWTESHAAMLVSSTLVDGCWWILRSNISLADGSENTPTTLEVPNGKLGGTTTWAKAEYDRLAPRFSCYPNPATLKIIEGLLDWFTGEMLQTTPIFDGYKKPWKTRSFLGEVGRRRSPKMGKDILLFPALPGMAHLINWTVSLGESFLSFFSVQFEKHLVSIPNYVILISYHISKIQLIFDPSCSCFFWGVVWSHQLPIPASQVGNRVLSGEGLSGGQQGTWSFWVVDSEACGFRTTFGRR